MLCVHRMNGGANQCLTFLVDISFVFVVANLERKSERGKIVPLANIFINLRVQNV